MIQRKLETRSLYRSVRYRVGRDETRTADPSACNFRIKRNSCLQSTLHQTIGSNFLATIQFKKTEKPDYLQSFHSMMERRVLPSGRDRSRKEASFFEDARVFIPEFQKQEKEVEDSEHSLLTPIMKPYRHVKAKQQLKSQRTECEAIKAELNKVKNKSEKQLEQIEKSAQAQFSGLRAILRKNQVQQQEKKLKFRRQLQYLETKHKQNVNQFTKIHEQSYSLQHTIFSSTPFELKQAAEYGEVYF